MNFDLSSFLIGLSIGFTIMAFITCRILDKISKNLNAAMKGFEEAQRVLDKYREDNSEVL